MRMHIIYFLCICKERSLLGVNIRNAYTHIYTIRDSHVLTGRNRMELFGTKVSQNVFIVRYSSQKVLDWSWTGG